MHPPYYRKYVTCFNFLVTLRLRSSCYAFHNTYYFPIITLITVYCDCFLAYIPEWTIKDIKAESSCSSFYHQFSNSHQQLINIPKSHKDVSASLKVIKELK